ncbi:DUF1080 domain-containing protein [Sphingobacterium alkalisoli]|uniref:DUF1080 domain-containing protein n=1 Tax=Sphingobacterium alkalisoli TaxID=1874115 RepID=A0A4U0GYB5_9SPHI|nr:DUF1080 domain-containing protein [Sphingobacterium alkalisoli]TJY64201.1 DUF1080 domain-containing protein [Sphingobacterium alkalisoli]GGH23201.1 hypothetical protein GCM10011418_30290 [Sphingobacterium alkalisoli]
MKKTFNILSVLLLFQVAAYAQQPVGRTSDTKIADVLAQQPAEEQAKFIMAMKELENFSAEDIANLLTGLKPQGGNNAAIEYASNSYAFYSMQPGFENKRAVYVNGLLLALDRIENKDNKGFVLELLKQCAKNEAIQQVSTYLTDDYLVGKAARVLNGIRTPEAASALNTALNTTKSEKAAVAIVAALGDIKDVNSETRILELIRQFESPNFQRNALTALSKIGGVASYDTFLSNARAVNYEFDKTNVAGLTLDYAHNLANKDQVLAGKLASTLYQEATKAQVSTIRVGALALLTSFNPKKQKKELLKLASSDDAIVRNVALDLLSQNASASDLVKLASSLKKLNPEAQESVLNFLGTKNADKAIPVIEKNLAAIKDSEVKIAAYNTLSILSKGENAAFLIKQIPAANEAERKALQTLLLTSKGNGTMDAVNSALVSSDIATQLVLLDVLKQRANLNSSNAVLALTESKDEAVRLAAFNALPNVVNDADFDAIINLLDRASDKETTAVQQAAIVALRNNAEAEAKIKRLSANISRSAAPSAAKYFPIFAGVGGSEALKSVKNYLNEGNVNKSHAISALANWSTPASLDALTALLRTEKHSENFNIAFRGFVKQLNGSTLLAPQKTLLLREAFESAQTPEQKKSALSALQSTGTYQALIFAGKYLSDPVLKDVATNVVMNIAMDNDDFVGNDVRVLLTKAKDNLSGSESSYLREAIVRHLAEMPQKEGYVSIFNGKDLTGWKGLVENPIKRAQMSAQELARKQADADMKMRESWSAIDGDLVFSGHGDNIATVKQYADFEMLVDWKLDKNGKEPDAGVYLRGTPQVQIWDISRINVGADVGSGGLYNNKSNSKPIKVADNPLGEWNTFKIRMIGEQVSVWLNGELVVDNVTLENYWDRNQSIFPKEQIELQAHGSRVWYRDVFIKEIPRKEVYSLNDQERQEGFEVLFDGTNLDKWTSSAAYEITEEGYIRSNPVAKFGKNIYTKEEYADFVYRFEFKLTPGANNGVGIRTPLEGDAAYQGMEIQILDDDADVYKKLAPYQYHGSVYGVIAAKRGALKPLGEWNEEEIRVKGSKITITLNGVVIVDGDLSEASKNGTLDNKGHPGLKRASGHIGFLGHGTEVFLRNIRVKRI